LLLSAILAFVSLLLSTIDKVMISLPTIRVVMFKVTQGSCRQLWTKISGLTDYVSANLKTTTFSALSLRGKFLTPVYAHAALRSATKFDIKII